MAEARKVGAATTKARALGGKSFGVAPFKRRCSATATESKWQREVRQCFGLTAPALSEASPSAELQFVNVLVPLYQVSAPGLGALSVVRKEADNQRKADAECEDELRKWSSSKNAAGVLSGIEFADATHLPLDGVTFCEVVPLCTRHSWASSRGC